MIIVFAEKSFVWYLKEVSTIALTCAG